MTTIGNRQFYIPPRKVWSEKELDKETFEFSDELVLKTKEATKKNQNIDIINLFKQTFKKHFPDIPLALEELSSEDYKLGYRAACAFDTKTSKSAMHFYSPHFKNISAKDEVKIINALEVISHESRHYIRNNRKPETTRPLSSIDKLTGYKMNFFSLKFADKLHNQAKIPSHEQLKEIIISSFKEINLNLAHLHKEKSVQVLSYAKDILKNEKHARLNQYRSHENYVGKQLMYKFKGGIVCTKESYIKMFTDASLILRELTADQYKIIKSDKLKQIESVAKNFV